MRTTAVASLMMSLAVPLQLYAQDSVVGKYSGSVSRATVKGEMQVGLDLVIASVDNGAVKGSATSYAKNCGGAFPIEGTYVGNSMDIKSTASFGSAGDCALHLLLRAEGNKLVGETGNGRPVQLSK